MATTTTYYGFDIPQSSDLVKDGATAIATLGQDIDTAMNTALGTKKSGLVLLNTTSFSAVASQAVTSIFSANYRFYKVILDITIPTADAGLNIKLRNGATDASTGYYQQAGRMASSGTGTSLNLANATSGFDLGGLDVGQNLHTYSFDMNFYRPFESERTTMTVLAHFVTQAGDFQSFYGGGVHITASSYDGFNVIASAGNITGVLQTYGFNQ